MKNKFMNVFFVVVLILGLTQSSLNVFAIDPPTSGSGELVLDVPTKRTLPIEKVTDNMYSNVTYFDVDSADSWNDALTKDNNNFSEITYLNITGDFALSDKTTGAAASMKESILHTNQDNKKLIINGNQHTIDFRGQTHWLDDVDWDVIIQNLTFYGSNDWGVFEGYNSGESPTITFYNVHQTGAQAYEGSRGKVILGGTSSFHSSDTESYISPIDNQEVELDKRYTFAAYKGSANIAASEIYVKANSNLTVNNGRLGSNFVVFPKGNFYVEDGGKTTLQLLNTDTGSAGDKWYVNDYSPAAISIVSDLPATVNPWPDDFRPPSLLGKSNSIYIGENVEVTIKNGAARENNAGAIVLQNVDSSFELGKNAKVAIEIEADSKPDAEGQTPIAFTKNSGILKLDEGAILNLTVGSASDTTQGEGSAIKFSGKESFLTVGENAQFIVKSSNDTKDGLINFDGKDSQIQLEKDSLFDLQYLKENQQPLIQMKAGKIVIPSSGDYIHMIQEWQSMNFDEGNPDKIFQPLNQTVIDVDDADFPTLTTDAPSDVQQEFTNGFSNKVQRIVVEPTKKNTPTPTALVKDYHVIEGDNLPEAIDFVTSVSDTDGNPYQIDDFNYQYVGSTIQSNAIATITNGQDEERMKGEIVVIDKNNHSSAPIPVQVIIHKASSVNAIHANDATLHLSEVNGYTEGSSNYQSFLIKKIKAEAYTISKGDWVSLPIEIENLMDVKTKIGDYPLHLVVKKDPQLNLPYDLVTGNALRIISNLVNPEDPSDNQVVGNENDGTGSDKEIRLDYVPSTFDFGQVAVSPSNQLVQATGIGSSQQWIQVSDNQTQNQNNGWLVKAQISDFVSVIDATKVLRGVEMVLPKGNTYNKKTGSQPNPQGLISFGSVSLSQNEQTIFSGKGENSKNESTYVWNKKDVSLKIPGGQGENGQQYQATITWIIEASVTN